MHIETRGEGTPLVVIHGFGVDHRIMLPLDPVLAARGGWKRIYLDLPGMGRSPIGDISSSEDMAAAVTEAVREVTGGELFAVLGSSYGGMLARRIAHELPEQVLGLATLVGVFVAEHAKRDVPERTVLHEEHEVFADAPTALRAGYRGVAVWQSAAGFENFVASVQPGLDAADEAALERVSGSYSFEVEPEDAASAPFTKPALFITGRQDEVVGYADAWRRLDHYPRASFLVLDAAGHGIIGEQPELVGAALGEWLDRVRAHAAG